MHVTLVSIAVRPEHIPDFIAATRLNQEASAREPGNLRFDFLQNIEEPGAFLLYEAYVSEEAASQHKQTDHYLRWRDTVATWMASPRKGTPYRALSSLDPKSGV